MPSSTTPTDYVISKMVVGQHPDPTVRDVFDLDDTVLVRPAEDDLVTNFDAKIEVRVAEGHCVLFSVDPAVVRVSCLDPLLDKPIDPGLLIPLRLLAVKS